VIQPALAHPDEITTLRVHLTVPADPQLPQEVEHLHAHHVCCSTWYSRVCSLVGACSIICLHGKHLRDEVHNCNDAVIHFGRWRSCSAKLHKSMDRVCQNDLPAKDEV
jgi:hypothetical protein